MYFVYIVLNPLLYNLLIKKKGCCFLKVLCLISINDVILTLNVILYVYNFVFDDFFFFE